MQARPPISSSASSSSEKPIGSSPGSRQTTQPDAWRKSSFVGGATLPVTVDELKSIRADLRAALAPYVRRLSDRSDWPADARFVRILLAGTPLELDPASDNPEESA